MSTQIKVSGRNTQDSLDRVVTKIEAELVDVVQESAEAMREGIRRRVPVDSGALYEGVEIHYGDGGLSAEVGFDDPELYYADFVENGTSAQPAQPFMRPTAAEEEQELPGRVARAVNGVVR